MFDLIVNQRNPAHRNLAPIVISWALHALVLGAFVILPLIFATNQLPAVPKEMLTYVTMAAPPPPPPPPAPASSTPTVKPTAPRSATTPRRVMPAPVVAPRELPPTTVMEYEGEGDFDGIDGVAGGVPGGVLGGVLGGVVGGLVDMPALPPPPPPPAPRAPIRTGGQIEAPALLTRVAPVYPPLALNAKVQGVVILEATVGREGRVENVEVLRSIALLDKAAIEAVRQWVYAPLLLNGIAERFTLTVTLNFSLS